MRKDGWMIALTLKGHPSFPGMTLRKGISGEKAMRLFDSDNYDSDGDGISNLMERAFGGDSLSNDSKSIMPRSIRKKDGYEYIIFSRFSDAYNTGDDKIEYIVETSRDLRTWYDTSSAEGAELIGTPEDLGGGMERVVFRSKKTRYCRRKHPSVHSNASKI